MLVARVDELRARALAHVEATFAAPPPAGAFAQRRRAPASSGVTAGRCRSRSTGEVDALVKALARYHVLALDSHEADLEDIFLALYRGEGSAMLRSLVR